MRPGAPPPATRLTASSGTPMVPALLAASGARAFMRFLEFFVVQIRNLHTPRAYMSPMPGST